MKWRDTATATVLLLLLMNNPLPAQERYLLEGATVINGVYNKARKDYVVVVQGGKITGVGQKKKVIIPPNTPVIDLTGKYIIPGLIDAHVHEGSVEDWQTYLSWGITSVNCMYESSDTALEREKWSQPDSVRTPVIYGTAPVFSPRGIPWEGEGFADDPTVDTHPESDAAARTAVRTLKAKGIRRIKLIYDDMSWGRDPLPALKKMDSGTMTALLGEANRLGVVSEIHAPLMNDAREAAEAGATALMHGIIDEPVDALFVNEILSRDMFYVPTFCLYYFLADADSFMAGALSDVRIRNSLDSSTIGMLRSGQYREEYRSKYPNREFVASHLKTAVSNTGTMVSNYAQVVTGSDMRALPGIGTHLEMEYMVASGLTPMQALTSSTFLAAKFLGVLKRTGTIEPGRDADIVVLDEDPLADIRNTRSVSMIIKRGAVYTPSQLRKANRP